MPPHLRRRTPLRQQIAARRKFLLLPFPLAQTASPARIPRHPLHLRASSPRRPQRHPGRHHLGSPAHRHRLPRLETRRSAPLRLADRVAEPAQSLRRAPGISRRNRDRRSRRHDRPHLRIRRQTRRNPLRRLHRATLATGDIRGRTSHPSSRQNPRRTKAPGRRRVLHPPSHPAQPPSRSRTY